MTKPLVALLSGAGVSTDSGIPDYRGPNGLWRRDPEAEKLVTYEFYMADPEIRRRSWQMRRTNHTLQAEPNADGDFGKAIKFLFVRKLFTDQS